MSDIDWDDMFDEVRTQPGAAEKEISEFLTTALAPLTSEEMETIRNSHSNPYPESDPLYSAWKPVDPTTWAIPNRPFPKTYLSLLRWSNGAECRTGKNWFMFFPANDPRHGVRAMMLGYHVPGYLPGFVPFAFDGAGTFYLFDMRQAAVEGEYAIAFSHSSELDLQETTKIADSLAAACRGEWTFKDLD